MSVTDAPEPPRPTAGVDWANTDHAAAIIDSDGEQIARFSIAHDAAGLHTLVRRFPAAQVSAVGIERPDGPVIDALRQAGLVVYVIPPGQLKNLRSRYGSAGNGSAGNGSAGNTFRWGADKQLRDALCDFAGDSRHANPWAADLYRRARARGHDHPHAVRILARARVDIIWACWTTNTPYDPDQHNALQRILNQDQTRAA